MDKQTEKEVSKLESSEARKEGNVTKVKELLETAQEAGQPLGVKKTAQMLINSTPKRLWEENELIKYFPNRSDTTVSMQLRKLLKENDEIRKIKLQGVNFYGLRSVINNVNIRIRELLFDACHPEIAEADTEA
jgi:hypothetical protein